jgi:3-hydroxymyristoyl/3-hydroxydecanoyl-(acyl carrier protein) dehydratase
VDAGEVAALTDLSLPLERAAIEAIIPHRAPFLLVDRIVGAVCAHTHPDHRGKFGVFAGIDEVRFSRIVRPGDRLDAELVVDRLRGRIGRASASLTVDGEQAVRGVLTFALLEEAPA